jgi:SnoaL-like domain
VCESRPVIDRSSVQAWVAAYERAWRTPGTSDVGELFTDGATYRMSPFQPPHRGIDAIRALWDAERSRPDEVFEMAFEVVAVENPRAVVRLEVQYGPPQPQLFRDLWILEFDPDGRCRAFEEWPFSPARDAPHHEP